MSELITYDITNRSQLKQTTQQVINNTAIDLGFTTARKSIDIRIRFAKGASHCNWMTGQYVESQQLALWLVKGFKAGRAHKKIRGRPVFDQYLAFHKDEMKNICVRVFNGSGSIRDKAQRAGEEVLRDLKRRIYQGSFYLAPNGGTYAIRKMRAGLGDTPLVAAKRLFEDLEVVVE